MSRNELPDHIQKPHLRRLQPLPSTKDGQQLILLRDPLMLADQTMAVPRQIMMALQQFNGEHDLQQIGDSVKQDPQVIQELVEKLDEFGLLWGPTFDGLERDKKVALEERGAYPVRATTPLGKDENACRMLLDSWIGEGDDPEIEFEASGLFAPQLEYPHTWPIFAACWKAMQQRPAPDRVIVMSTNHYGIGDGMVCTRLGFETPIGRCDTDPALLEAMLERVGDRVLADELDHVASTGIELQLPWIQHCWGNLPIIGLLVPDPLQDLIEDDDARIGRSDFMTHLREGMEEVGGSTVVIGSGDLSHVGPQFGEPRPVDDQRRFDVERQDRELLGHAVGGDSEAFTSAISWNKNPTRWSGAGVVAAMLELLQPSNVELIDYRQAVNKNQTALVSCCGVLMG